jgi:hypothetical protein
MICALLKEILIGDVLINLGKLTVFLVISLALHLGGIISTLRDQREQNNVSYFTSSLWLIQIAILTGLLSASLTFTTGD